MIAKTMRVDRWGDSLGIHFPCDFVDIMQLKETSLVEITTDGKQLIITKARDNEPRKNIKELFSEYPIDYIEDNEHDWGSPIGGEIW